MPEPTAYRPGHKLGNVILSGMVRRVFGSGISDMLSGYRVFSRRFVKSFPALTCGFETETEFTVHALALNMPIAEVRAPLSRPSCGIADRNSTPSPTDYSILREIVTLDPEHERPLPFFSFIMAISPQRSLSPWDCR